MTNLPYCRSTFMYEQFPEVMNMLWIRMLKDNKKNWRRVYKVQRALLILHHIFTFKWDTIAERKCTLHAQCLVKIIGRAYIQGILCTDFDMRSPPWSQINIPWGGVAMTPPPRGPCYSVPLLPPVRRSCLYISLLLNLINFFTQSNTQF